MRLWDAQRGSGMTALFQHYLPPAPAMLPYVSGRFYASQHARAVGGAVAIARELGGAYGLGIIYAKSMFNASEGH